MLALMGTVHHRSTLPVFAMSSLTDRDHVNMMEPQRYCKKKKECHQRKVMQRERGDLRQRSVVVLNIQYLIHFVLCLV